MLLTGMALQEKIVIYSQIIFAMVATLINGIFNLPFDNPGDPQMRAVEKTKAWASFFYKPVGFRSKPDLQCF